MGLVLDSGVLIAAEREARPVSGLLAILAHVHGETEIVLSSITVVELEHGLHRANTAELARKRRDYLNTVFAAIPVEPFTREMAQLAAKVDAESRLAGHVIPFPDLLIGVTALHFGYAVGTRKPSALSDDPQPEWHRAPAAFTRRMADKHTPEPAVAPSRPILLSETLRSRASVVLTNSRPFLATLDAEAEEAEEPQ